MRLVGPNCLGLINTDPAVRLNATFAPLRSDPGGLALVSQSGALGIAVLLAARRCGLGISQFVSIGNKADVSGNDLLMAWGQDDHTEVIALYLESFGNPRRFARIARRVSRSKPIIAIKAGRTEAGQRAGQSHTAAAASSDVVVDALFDQAGVIRIDTMEQMLDAARALAGQPLPRGPRVGIIGNSGGPGILAADAAAAAGLEVVDLSAQLRAALVQAAPSVASSQNPIDLGAGAQPAETQAALTVLLRSDEVDAVLGVFTETLVAERDELLTAVAHAAAASSKPLITTQVGDQDRSLTIAPMQRALPVFAFPERAAQALALAWRYARIRSAPVAAAVRPADLDVTGAREVANERLAAGGGWLEPRDIVRLLARYGIEVCPQRVVGNVVQAEQAAQELGYPIAMKIAGQAVHKSDVGGVRVDLRDDSDLRAAFGEIREHWQGEILLQPMVTGGAEIIVGGLQDIQFGPVVMVGAGGVFADVLGDRRFLLAPVDERSVLDSLDELRFGRLLDGYRGRPKVSRPALADLVARVGLLVDDLPEVAEIDLNPVIGRGEELVVVDAKIRVAAAASRPEQGIRRLSEPAR
jgi:acyl-CoA synthetase (NDP forming)